MLERYYYTQAGDDEPGFLNGWKTFGSGAEKAETSGVKIAVRNEFWSVLRGEKDRAVLAARSLPGGFTIPRIWRT